MNIDAPSLKQIPMLRALWQEAFGDGDEFLDAFFETAFSKDRCRIVVEGGNVACALYWFDTSFRGEKLAYLYAIATAKAYRGRGICRALMENTRKHLLENGYIGAILVPGSRELFTFYEKLGYHTCSTVGEICCKASDTDAKIRKIDIVEYARLRKALLPEGSVVQENENLDFLLTMAELYTGDGFVLSARKEGEALHGVELLGDYSAAEGIARALGCSEGKFRIPGGETPFAMCDMFRDTDMPAYFGLAFD